MSTPSARGLAVIARSSNGHPRTFRLDRHAGSRDAAYRRLATAILRLDVASLATELRAGRLGVSEQRAA